MLQLFTSLFLWMPIALRVFVGGAFLIFFVLVLLRLWAFIMDLIPFL